MHSIDTACSVKGAEDGTYMVLHEKPSNSDDDVPTSAADRDEHKPTTRKRQRKSIDAKAPAKTTIDGCFLFKQIVLFMNVFIYLCRLGIYIFWKTKMIPIYLFIFAI